MSTHKLPSMASNNTSPSNSLSEDEHEHESEEVSSWSSSTTTITNNNKDYVPLCRAIQMGDWEKAQEFFNKDKDALTDKLNADDYTALHVAIGNSKNIEFVENLLELINPESLPRLMNDEKETVLHRAALLDNTSAAKKLVEKNPHLLFIADDKEHLPIEYAIFNSHKATSLYLLQVCKQHIGLSQQDGYHNPFEGEFGVSVLGNAIISGLLDIAYDLLKDYPELATTNTTRNLPPLWSIAKKCDAYPSAKQYNFYQRFVYSHLPTKNYAFDDAYPVRDIENQEAYRTNLVTMCTQSYIYPAIEWIYAKFWEVTLLHVADKDKNNLLHLVAHLAPTVKLEMVTGAALQVRRYKCKGSYSGFREREKKNNRQETPIMVFRKEHKDLRQKGEEWIKKTTDSYTITAVLIITIVFAAAITVPGGNNGQTGKAIFRTSASFIIFVVSDAISFYLCLLISSLQHMVLEYLVNEDVPLFCLQQIHFVSQYK
ncbi:hypothetical protein L1987_83482 [Smallanthus sonchifolius]|uniref:Uncharacterized protein n=1 Tax=Smallanthus sonchifolius TaxID=185202 RepID=A0ACB8YC41_9ASTR|nr:hypothetical protein L1987_83482 [Smallanthus sonchifolius]